MTIIKTTYIFYNPFYMDAIITLIQKKLKIRPGKSAAYSHGLEDSRDEPMNSGSQTCTYMLNARLNCFQIEQGHNLADGFNTKQK